MRRRITSGATPAMARSICEGARCGEAEPHIKGARTQRGRDFNGRKAASGRAHPSQGKGFLAKVAHRMRATSPAGERAAMRMAMGPEKDSPNRMNRRSRGSATSTRASSSSYPKGRSLGYATMSDSTPGPKLFTNSPNSFPVPSRPGSNTSVGWIAAGLIPGAPSRDIRALEAPMPGLKPAATRTWRRSRRRWRAQRRKP